MLFTSQNISFDELDKVTNFFEEFDKLQANEIIQSEPENNVSKYINSLANGCYAKAVDDIANTKIGNRVVRKRNLQQVMRESFFYGANRFGNNFIA